jgi:hypothetical protein
MAMVAAGFNAARNAVYVALGMAPPPRENVMPAQQKHRYQVSGTDDLGDVHILLADEQRTRRERCGDHAGRP